MSHKLDSRGMARPLGRETRRMFWWEPRMDFLQW